MMKTLCVAVVLLSLTSVCQPAPLVCEELLKPVVTAPNFAGTWYWIAMSTDNCAITALLKAVPLSLKIDFTSRDTPNFYDSTLKMKTFGYCVNESRTFFYPDSISDLANNNATVVLLQSGCPDCLVAKGNTDGFQQTVLLLSRRENVTAVELKEFEMQTKCLGLPKQQVLHSDPDYENCLSADNDNNKSRLDTMLIERIKVTSPESIPCIAETLGVDF